jgi:hypothetical protein
MNTVWPFWRSDNDEQISGGETKGWTICATEAAARKIMAQVLRDTLIERQEGLEDFETSKAYKGPISDNDDEIIAMYSKDDEYGNGEFFIDVWLHISELPFVS